MNAINLECVMCGEDVDPHALGVEDAGGGVWFGQCPHCGQRYNNDDPADLMAEMGEEGE